MVLKHNILYMLATAAATAASWDGIDCLSAVSWTNPRVDLFGLADRGSVWHKFYTGWDWQPFDGFEYLHERSVSSSCPAVSSWGEGRLDVVYLASDKDTVTHTYYGGGSWGTDDLGNNDVVALGSASWGENRLDIFGRTKKGSYVHKAWIGDAWFPDEDEWEDFGGSFFSNPTVVSWGEGRVDVIGLSDDGSLQHLYYQDGWSKWESLGGGPFVGNPVATSWGPDRLDFWAIDSEGELNHLCWDGSRWSEWEQLGGAFTDTPNVAHWNESKIDIVGKGQDDNSFYHKSYDGAKWNPEGREWDRMGGPYASEPAVLAKHETNFLYVFGVSEDEELRMQIWTGYDWQPGFNQTWPLGDVRKEASSAALIANGPKILDSLEL
ncbi:unnamed protein product [Discula destructiva]